MRGILRVCVCVCVCERECVCACVWFIHAHVCLRDLVCAVSHLAAARLPAAPSHLQSVCCTTPHATHLPHATRRNVGNNQLVTLPAGIFDALTSLTSLCVRGGAGGGRWRGCMPPCDAGVRAVVCMWLLAPWRSHLAAARLPAAPSVSPPVRVLHHAPRDVRDTHHAGTCTTTSW